MKLKQVEIENFRAISKLTLPLDENLTVLYGKNADGKTSVLSGIAVGLGSIPRLLPDVAGIDFRSTDLRGRGPMRVKLTTRQDVTWARQRYSEGRRTATTKELQEFLSGIIEADLDEASTPRDLPIFAYYDTDRAVFDVPQRRGRGRKTFPRYAALNGALSARTSFREFFNWFYEKEFEELRLHRDGWPAEQKIKDLETVRRAISSMIPGASNPRIASRPSRFVVSIDFGPGHHRNTFHRPTERRLPHHAGNGSRPRATHGTGQPAHGRPSQMRSSRPGR